jgi:hypothetical protein
VSKCPELYAGSDLEEFFRQKCTKKRHSRRTVEDPKPPSTTPQKTSLDLTFSGALLLEHPFRSEISKTILDF